MTSQWISFFVVLATIVVHASAQCSFKHINLQAKQPLLLSNENKYRDLRRLVPVDDAGNVNLKQNETITIACPGNYNYMSGGNSPPVQSLAVSCSSGYSFKSGSTTINLNSVACYNEPYHDIRMGYEQATCGSKLTLVEVGYVVGSEFLTAYDVCFDQQKLTPVSARNVVRRGGGNTRTGTMSAYLYNNVNPVTAYTLASQNSSFVQQLGVDGAKKYISSTHLLQNRFLVVRDAFIYGPNQLAPYFYFNSIPVWKVFNNGLLSSLETAVKTLTNIHGDLQIHTEVNGVSTLPNSAGVESYIYLYADAEGQRFMPVPEFVMKSVRNERGEEVVFVMLQQRSDTVRSARRVCAEDVCAQLRWLPWAQVPPAERNIICCRADDPLLLQRVPGMRARAARQPSAGLLAA